MSMLCLVKHIICSSIKNLFYNQPDISQFTSETGKTEWNLAHHLANELSKYIFWLNHDLDVTKRNYEKQRPDIIFHKRGINKLNFLVIELKRTDNVKNDIKKIKNDIKKIIKNDIKKIKEDWMKPNLSYRFGASIVIEDHGNWWYGLIFERGSEDNIEFSSEECIDYLPLPSNETLKCQIKNLVSQILTLTQDPTYDTDPQKQDQIKDLEKQIDQLVYQLYNLTDEEISIIEGGKIV